MLGLMRSLSKARAASLRKAADPAGPPARTGTSGFTSAGNPYGQPAWKDWDAGAAVKYGFKACTWVYACIDRLMKAVGSVPWKSMRLKGEEWEPDKGSDYEVALEGPSDDMSRNAMMSLLVAQLGVAGNGLMEAVFVGATTRNPLGRLYGFEPMNVVGIAPVMNGRRIGHYETPDKKEQWLPQQVVHPMFMDPTNPWWGMSPLRAIGRVVDMDVRQVLWNRNAVENNMVPQGAIVDPNLKTEFQRQEMADALQEHYAGADNARRPLVIPYGQQFLRMSMTPQEMDWLESRRFTLIEICAAFGMLPSLFNPETKYSNLEEAIKFMWENGAVAYLSAIEEALNIRLVPRKLRRELWIHYDLSSITALQDNLVKRLEGHVKAIAAGVPPNRSFVMFDIPCPPQDGGDIALRPINLEPLDPELNAPAPGGAPDPFGGAPAPKPGGGGDQAPQSDQADGQDQPAPSEQGTPADGARTASS